MNYNIIFALIKKEVKEIKKDFSSILIAFIMPLMLLFLFGFGINFDTNTVKIGIVDFDNTEISRDISQSLVNSKYLDCQFYKTINSANSDLAAGKIRGYTVFPVNFIKEFKKNKAPKIQIVTDGTEPNTAKFVSSYIQGAVGSWFSYKNKSSAIGKNYGAEIRSIVRTWYNPSLKSRYFILPGSLSIIMTMTGTVLTALVVAKEWERGTMEALLTTEVTKYEFVLSKYISYFILGFLSISFCLFVIIVIARIPFYGSYLWLVLTSALFMLNGIGIGMLISTLFKEQFASSQMAGSIGFMPSMMLSGLIYEIDSTPAFIKILSYIVPAKYYVSSSTSLFLSGTITKTLVINSIYMAFFAIFIFILILKFTKERIEEC